MSTLVIVGASLAGLRAARAARNSEWDGDIVVVGEELHMPYTRPPLSKELLTSNVKGLTDCLLPAELEVRWMLDERATGLDRSARRVTLSGGEQVAYDRLVIATGSRARRWAGPGAELAGVHVLRNLEDALALREAFAAGPRVAIVGAGFIGCEVASSARELGLDVTLFDVVSTPMQALGPLIGERCAALQRAHGVDLRLGVGIEALRGSEGRVRELELSDGTRYAADLIVMALGAIPCTDWLADAGLLVEQGIACDATLTLDGDPNVLAAGDVAAWPHALAGGRRIRVEHWTNAAEQGALAGRNAVVAPSERQAYAGVPSFWSDQFGIKIQAVGLPQLAESYAIVEESDDGVRLVAVAQRAGMLIGAIGFDAARRLLHYRRLLGDPIDVDELQVAAAEDPNALGTPARMSA